MQILKYLLVALFVSYYCESTFFLHTHNFDWGTVTHSHPYMPTGSHSHTSAQCQTIESLANLLFTLVATAFIVATIRVIVLSATPDLRRITRRLVRNYSLRAPPVSVC